MIPLNLNVTRVLLQSYIWEWDLFFHCLKGELLHTCAFDQMAVWEWFGVGNCGGQVSWCSTLQVCFGRLSCILKRIISKNHMGLCVFTKYLGHNGIVGELLERHLRTDLTLKHNPWRLHKCPQFCCATWWSLRTSLLHMRLEDFAINSRKTPDLPFCLNNRF